MTDGVAALTPELLRRLWVDQHMSFREVARQVGCSPSAVAGAVRRHGLTREPRQPRPDSAVVTEIVRLYTDERFDLRQVSARTGVPRDRVSAVLRDAGVQLRRRGSRVRDGLDAEALRARYEAGVSLRQLALEERTDDDVIRDALLKAGATIRQPGGTARWAGVLTREFLTHRYVEGGASVRAIAAETGAHYETVRVALLAFGMRTPGERR